MHGIRRGKDGLRVGLARQERELLRALAAQLVEELQGEERDDGLARLFPTAYPDDEEAAAEWAELARPALEEGKAGALRRLGETAEAERLGEEDAGSWLTALNDLRLVLGTRLGVTEDSYAEQLHHPGFAVYAWLTWLQGELVEALAAGL
jgi:Domain of unknown function (DUF2017)